MVTEKMIEAAARVLNRRLADGSGLHGVSRAMLEAALSTAAEPVAFTSQGQIDAAHNGSTALLYGKRDEFMDIALYAAPPAPSVAVKALEWDNADESGDDVWRCVTVMAEQYSITRWWLDYHRNEVGHFEVEELGERQFGNIDEAKAAAQADYEARIRSALSAQVQDVAGQDDTHLEEIADGAWGDDPAMRGRARDELARRRTTAPAAKLEGKP